MENKADLAKVGAAKRAETLKQNKGDDPAVLSPGDKTAPATKHDTSEATVKRAGKLAEEIDATPRSALPTNTTLRRNGGRWLETDSGGLEKPL